MFNEGKDFILYAWNDETKEFWFLGEKIDYVHNPKEWKKYLNDLVSENKQLKEKVKQLESTLNEVKEWKEEFGDACTFSIVSNPSLGNWYYSLEDILEEGGSNE